MGEEDSEECCAHFIVSPAPALIALDDVPFSISKVCGHLFL